MKVDPPKRLSREAKKKFRELEPYYLLNSPLMVEVLAQYCELHEKYIRAEEELKTGTIALKDGLAEHGAMKTQFKCLDSMRRLIKILTDNGTQNKVEKLTDSLGLD